MLLLRMLLPGFVAIAILIVSSAQAAPVVLEYAGTVTLANGFFLGQGSLVAGTIHFDDSMVDLPQLTGNANQDEFRFAANPSQTFEMFMTIEIEIGNVSWTTEDNLETQFSFPPLNNIQQNDGPTADTWSFDIVPLSISEGDSSGRISLRSDGLSDALLPGSGGLTDQILIPMPENFETTTGFFTARDSTSTPLGQVNFTVDEIVVPEPALGIGLWAAPLLLLLKRPS